MKVLYTLSAKIALVGVAFRNPQHFLNPERGATEVLIDGDYPKIKEAYEKLNIKVSQYKADANPDVSSDSTGGAGTNTTTTTKNLTVDQIKALLTEKGIEFTSSANKAELLKLLEEAKPTDESTGGAVTDNTNPDVNAEGVNE